MAKILVVEDDSQIAEAIQLNLEVAGHQAIIAGDGLEALRLVDTEHPDLITVDLGLPQISGFRLVELLKRGPNPAPVIVITALSFQEGEEVARSGADDFLTKPVDPQEIVRRVESLLARLKPG